MEDIPLSLFDALCCCLDTKTVLNLSGCSKYLKNVMEERIDRVISENEDVDIIKFTRTILKDSIDVNNLRKVHDATKSLDISLLTNVLKNDDVFTIEEHQNLFIRVCFDIKSNTKLSQIEAALVLVVKRFISEFERLKHLLSSQQMVTTCLLVAKLITEVIKWLGTNGISVADSSLLSNCKFLTTFMGRLKHFHEASLSVEYSSDVLMCAIVHVGALKYCLMNRVSLRIGTRGGFYFMRKGKKAYITQRHLYNLYY